MWLYKMTNNSNGKEYIGATSHPIRNRMARHESSARRGETSAIAQAIREFGIACFSVQILAYAEVQAEANRLEQELILQHKTLQPDGYNMTADGRTNRGREISIETRQKLSARLRGNKNGLGNQSPGRRGQKISAEHREKISRAHVGIKHSAQSRRAISEGKRGKTHAPISQAAREKIRQSLMGHSVSEETRRKISASLKARKGETQIETPI